MMFQEFLLTDCVRVLIPMFVASALAVFWLVYSALHMIERWSQQRRRRRGFPVPLLIRPEQQIEERGSDL